jgi:hypothetical protein
LSETDRRALAQHFGIAERLLGGPDDSAQRQVVARPAQRFVVAADAVGITVRRMCESGRCFVRVPHEPRKDVPLVWDGDEPWSLRMAITRDAESDSYAVEGWLERHDVQLTLTAPDLRTADGVLITEGRVGHVLHHGAYFLTTALSSGTLQQIPREDALDLVRELYALPQLPPVALPEELEVDTISTPPVPRLLLRKTPAAPWSPPSYEASLAFEYSGTRINADVPTAGMVHLDEGRVVRRDHAVEVRSAERLEQVGFKRETEYGRRRAVLKIAESRGVQAAVELLDGAGHVRHAALTGEPLTVRLHYAARQAVAGAVFGIMTKPVTPPLIAASAQVAMFSLSSWPGSRA